jgi:ATP phosphoribosyltransferase regulatory subunit
MDRPVLFEKPPGVRDYLPPLARRKREIEQTIAGCFQRWGYKELITPSFEYVETFQAGSLRAGDDRAFKFFDRAGKTLMLRPDMTAPIARVAASLYDEPLPMRFSYTANIFRQQERLAGRDTEFTQSGVELIGDRSVDADAEIIALAVHALREAGLPVFRIAVGHVGFLEGFLREHIADEEVRIALKSELADKNYVGFEQLVIRQSFPEEARQKLLALPRLRGGMEILAQAEELAGGDTVRAALSGLRELWHLLEIHGVADAVQIDLSLLLGLNYYTGMILEGYAPGIGFPVCAGGRYDELLGRFGRPLPATGFIIGVDRVLEILEKEQPSEDERPWIVIYDLQDRATAIRFSAYLRDQGFTVCGGRRNRSGERVSDGNRPPGDARTVIFQGGNVFTGDPQIQKMWERFVARGDAERKEES